MLQLGDMGSIVRLMRENWTLRVTLAVAEQEEQIKINPGKGIQIQTRNLWLCNNLIQYPGGMLQKAEMVQPHPEQQIHKNCLADI